MSAEKTWIRVEFGGARARAIGATHGVAPSLERRWRLRAIRAREEVREAHEEGILPHGRWWAAGPPEVAPIDLPAQVVGEPGAIAAVLLGTPAGQGVTGSSWSVPEDGQVLRVDGGPHLPGEGSVDEDLRFGAFGPAAQQIRQAVFGSEQNARIDDLLSAAVARCGQAESDPSVDLAMALCTPAFDAKPLLVVADPGLEPLAQWWSRAASAVTCKPATDGPSHVSRGLPCSVSVLGDEAVLQAALHADPPPWMVFLRNDRASGEVASVRNATKSLIVRAGLPSFDVRLPDALPSTMLASAWVCLEALLAVAVAVGVEPLTMIPGEDLRARIDSGGGRPD